ncbi:hypothetical protein Cgig2_003663 [Carnegiea gigantea]|uniref:Uncharacterized protein n=1 Tax=Carnegiea gigantea TaxID=171969 RepID=A0A9Q1GM19_9CARY|nr:hypothetical protein Cgig2_003663 [Carnegiea gigantea]
MVALSRWIPRQDNGVVPGPRRYDQRCCATTPSTYGGARHANKPGHCAMMSSTYDGMNWGNVRHTPVPMVNLSWKFAVDLLVELWELPAKMTELGSSGSYLSWASTQLGVEAAGQVMGCQLANHPSWVVTPPRDTPLGKTPFPQGMPVGQPWEEWTERVHCLGFSSCKMTVAPGGFSWRLRRTRSSCLFKEFKCDTWEGSWQSWLSRDASLGDETRPVKRHAPSRVCERRPSPPFPYK